MKPTLLTIILVFVLTGPAFAQGWTERKYDPPAGSKWQIVSDNNSVEYRAKGEQRDQRVQMRVDLSIDEKLPDGYRVTYISREIKVTGNAPAVALVSDAYGAMTNIPIRARLSASGRPVAVENLAEVKAAMGAVVDRLVAKFDNNPKAAVLMRQMLQGLLSVENAEAAITYLDELPQLAVAQNSGLMPGDVRRETENVASPLGGGTFKTTLSTRLDSFDDKAGTSRIVRKRDVDPESMREVVTSIARQLATMNSGKTITPDMIELMKKVEFSIEGETVYDLDNGMTVRVDDREFTRASVMGVTFTKQQKKTVAVTRAN